MEKNTPQASRSVTLCAWMTSQHSSFFLDVFSAQNVMSSPCVCVCVFRIPLLEVLETFWVAFKWTYPGSREITGFRHGGWVNMKSLTSPRQSLTWVDRPLFFKTCQLFPLQPNQVRHGVGYVESPLPPPRNDFYREFPRNTRCMGRILKLQPNVLTIVSFSRLPYNYYY